MRNLPKSSPNERVSIIASKHTDEKITDTTVITKINKTVND